MALTFDVERFEHVTATPETALLRVSGRWVSDQRERLSPPMLVVDDGRRTHRLPALPGPEDAAPLADPDGPRWRAAFSAPAELIVNARNVFALDAGRGAVADLPRPVEARRERRAEPAPEPVDPAIAERAIADARAEAERRAAHEAEARERLEATSARQGARLAELEAEIERLVEARATADRVAHETGDDLRETRETLERHLAAEREAVVELEAA